MSRLKSWTVAFFFRAEIVGERNFAVMREHVHDMVTVSENEIVDALRWLWLRMKRVGRSALSPEKPVMAHGGKGKSHAHGVWRPESGKPGQHSIQSSRRKGSCGMHTGYR